MSESNSSNCDRKDYLHRISKLQTVIKKLQRDNKSKDYQISWMKAEIRMMKEAMSKFKKMSKDVLYEVDSMNETANNRCMNDAFVNWDGEEIYYPGEELPLSYKEWASASEDTKRKRAKPFSEYKSAVADNPNLFKSSSSD